MARLGGDEFALLLPALGDKSDAVETAWRVVEACNQPFIINGNSWQCSASVGLSFFPDDARSAELLQKNADLAMYCAKRTARGTVVRFEELPSAKAEPALPGKQATGPNVLTSALSLPLSIA